MTVTTLGDIRQRLYMTQDLPFSVLHSDEAITLILYKPQTPDMQEPHDQDEYYFVASGTGEVTVGRETTRIQTGDTVFVPAREAHSFSNTSDDFACWGLFFGPQK